METEDPSPRAHRALLVGAREPTLGQVRAALSGVGWTLRIASVAPADDLRPWFQERPDVVVVDAVGLGRSGLVTLVSRLRELDPDGAVPFVVLVEAGGSPELVHAAYDAGAADVLAAPFDPARLAERLQFQARAAQVMGAFHAELEELHHAQRLGGTGSWTLGLVAGLIRWSAEAERLLGVGPGGAPRDREALLALVPDDDREHVQQAFEECAEQGHRVVVQHRLPSATGTRWLEHAIEPVVSGEKTVGLRGTVRDVTSRREAERAEAEREAADPLTGLANREAFLDATRRAIDAGSPLAVLVLDLHGFRRINHTLGHRGGDLLLRHVADVLSSVALRARRPAPAARPLAARLAGDEFAVLLPGMATPEEVDVVAEQLLEAVSVPVPIAGREVWAAAKMGVALHPTDGSSADALLQHADVALGHAKVRPGPTAFFRRAMGVAARRRFTLEGDLQRALERGELYVAYQPRVRAADRRIVGAEALVRWSHPTLGAVPPSEFIPVAEETGLIGRIGAFVMRTACREFQPLRFLDPGLHVSVNVSSWQIAERNVWDGITAALRESGLAPGALELEITESLMLDGEVDTDAALRDLRAIGVRIALDDFGTGYSSLSYVTRFPVDVIKLDLSITREVADDRRAATVARTMIDMAHELELSVVAEGVDAEEQAHRLVALGADELQGFLFAGALRADDLRSRIAAQGRGEPAPGPGDAVER